MTAILLKYEKKGRGLACCPLPADTSCIHWPSRGGGDGGRGGGGGQPPLMRTQILFLTMGLISRASFLKDGGTVALPATCAAQLSEMFSVLNGPREPRGKERMFLLGI